MLVASQKFWLTLPSSTDHLTPNGTQIVQLSFFTKMPQTFSCIGSMKIYLASIQSKLMTTFHVIFEVIESLCLKI